jgi:hypothetical protein
MSDQAAAVDSSASSAARRALLVAVILDIAVAVCGFIFGFRNTAKHSIIWLLPIVLGLISVVMSVFAVRRALSDREMRGMGPAITAGLLGILCPFVGWLAILLGEVQREGPLW